MISASRPGPVTRYVRQRLSDLLADRRVVVWYDSERAFGDLVAGLTMPGCVVVSAAKSRLRARRLAEETYREIDEADGSARAGRSLLVYVPAARGATPEDQQQDPFEGFACCGAAFGDREAERLLSLTQLALPTQAAEIARLFRDGQPTLTLLDGLSAGARFPLVRQALGTDSPVEALATVLARPDTPERLEGVAGSLGELVRLAQTEIGLPAGPADSWVQLRDRLFTYLLVSELASSLPGGLSSALDTVPHADDAHRQRALGVCERLLESDAGRDAYAQAATAAEASLRLPDVLGDDQAPGSHDVFPCQERARLKATVRAATTGDLDQARSLLDAGKPSVWRHDPERDLLWRVTERCLVFLELAGWAERETLPGGVKSLLKVYTARDGLWRLDRAQRLYEQEAARCAQDDEVEAAIQVCRGRYRAVVERVQTAFQTAVRAEGWPPEGIRRQTQTFDARVAPELAERRKVAYFLVDSLRYEMGHDLAAALESLGSVSVEGVATVLPTTTACGMAALMPGADGALALVEHRGDLAPAVGGTALPGAAERKALLAERFGERLHDTTLEEVLSTAPRRLAGRFGAADFVLVRALDIDSLGEGDNLFRARKAMSEVIGEIRTAAVRLANLGFQTLVFAADHGHVLVPELPPGDVLTPPAGDWASRKRRSLLGRSTASAAGVLILKASDVGIFGPVEELAVATGLRTFRQGAGYFHEGLSLQECVVPVVVARVQRVEPAGGGEQVSISYRSDRFTSSVVGLKLLLTSLLSQSLTLRLEAFDGTSARARSVGRGGDCDARDPNTGEVTLNAGEETQVPLVIDPDFAGDSVEIRAVDPRTGAVLARLSLKNARMD